MSFATELSTSKIRADHKKRKPFFYSINHECVGILLERIDELEKERNQISAQYEGVRMMIGDLFDVVKSLKVTALELNEKKKTIDVPTDA